MDWFGFFSSKNGGKPVDSPPKSKKSSFLKVASKYSFLALVVA